MAKYTNLYSEQKNLNYFKKTDSAEMKIMIAIHMLFGVLNYPRSRMYWENKYRINIIADNMSRNRSFQLRNCFHVIDNESISNDNRNLSIKQYIKGKPTPWGINIILLCGQSGIVYNSLLYQGSNTNINDFMQKNYGLGRAVVLKLVENLKPNSHNKFFENFFSSYNLFSCLLKYRIFAIGTIQCNRFFNPPFPKDKELAKMGRGTRIPIQVKRFDRKEKCSVIIECPEIINLYNKNMGGVDKHDQLVSYYRTFIKSKNGHYG
ncbi:hypothetical protein QTP88_013236 [Uroleucon formosanum]